MEKEKQQEIMTRLGMFEQQMRQLQEQIDAVERGINDLGSLNTGLDELKDSPGREIMAPMGHGIFVEAKILSEKLLVDIGGKNFIKKDIPATKQIISEQIKKLATINEELHESIENTGQEMNKVLEEFQKERA